MGGFHFPAIPASNATQRGEASLHYERRATMEAIAHIGICILWTAVAVGLKRLANLEFQERHRSANYDRLLKASVPPLAAGPSVAWHPLHEPEDA